MGEHLGAAVGEGAVAVVHPDEVGVIVVVADVQVLETVQVQVGGGNGQPEAVACDAGFLCDVFESRTGVFIQAMREGIVVIVGALEGLVHIDGPVERMVGHVEIEVSIVVHIEKSAVAAVFAAGQAPGIRLFGEGAVAFVDEEQVLQLSDIDIGRQEIGRSADEDIEVAIVVHIGHGRSGEPSAGFDARFFGSIGKLHIALVQVKPGTGLVGGEEQVAESVAVHIARSHTAAVKEVLIEEDMHRIAERKLIGEGNTALFRFQFLKQFDTGCSIGLIRAFAGNGKQPNQGKEIKTHAGSKLVATAVFR